MAARNTFDVDEKLKDSFNFSMIKRSFVYIKKEKKLFFLALLFQTLSIVAALFGPVFTANALNE